MHLAQNVLELLQIGTPRLIFLGQQALDGVPEFLQPDAERMPSSRLVRAQRLAVQLLCFAEPFHGQTLRCQAFWRHEADTFAELAFQALPALVVKFSGQPESFLLEFRFLFLKESVKGYSELVVFRAVFSYPFVHNLGIAQFAQFAEQSLW